MIEQRTTKTQEWVNPSIEEEIIIDKEEQLGSIEWDKYNKHHINLAVYPKEIYVRQAIQYIHCRRISLSNDEGEACDIYIENNLYNDLHIDKYFGRQRKREQI